MTRPAGRLTAERLQSAFVDQEIADVATFVRNSWSNRAEPVSAEQDSDLCGQLKLPKPHRM